MVVRSMRVVSRIENEEDVQIIKEYTLLPILLDMLTRDMEELKIYKDKIVYNHVLFYLKEIETSIYPQIQIIKNSMKKRDIKVLNTTTNALGINVEYKVRGYIYYFTMLRSLVKAELMTTLMNMRRRI
jgi:CO dehydrogenase/acetyl-CoA synthase delta subunit